MLENKYLNFGGINKNGYLLGTIESIPHGLNPISELSVAELNLVREGLEEPQYKKAIRHLQHSYTEEELDNIKDIFKE